jgi:hypothetical protein
MNVKIDGCDSEKQEAIKTAAAEAWPFTEWKDSAGTLQCSALGFLDDDKWHEDTFCERLTVAIWQANGAYCKVVVTAVYLDGAPYEEYKFDENEYERLMKGNEGDSAQQPTAGKTPNTDKDAHGSAANNRTPS